MKNAKHYQNNNDDTGTHGVGTRSPAVIVEHDDFDGGKVHGSMAARCTVAETRNITALIVVMDRIKK